MSHAFAKRWDHTLKIKHIFMVDSDVHPIAAAETIKRGLAVKEAVTKLMDRIGEDDPLWQELDDCLDEFDLSHVTNDYEAQDRFNEALSNLYDIGDYGKRIWID